MPFAATYFTLSVGGLVVAGYLAYRHRTRVRGPLICPLDHDCGVVTESRYAEIFGVRNDALGIAYYLGLLVAGALSALFPNWSIVLRFPWIFAILVAACYSVYLLWVQVAKIRDYCFYCLIAIAINLLLLLNVIKLYVDALP